MSVKEISIKKVGKKFLISPHFKAGEFQSRDGADIVLYDDVLLSMLEKLRAYVGGTVGINSGYRSKAHNKKVGGASNSMHRYGYAADIVVKKDGKRVQAKKICCLCQSLGFKGIGYISEYAVHVDMRPSGKYRGDERKGYGNNVSDFYNYFGISKKEVEALKADVPDNDDEKKGENTMTQDQFESMLKIHESKQAEKDPADWSAEARKWAEDNGIIKGNDVSMAYLMPCTREQMVVFLYRFWLLMNGERL